jgi:hypothetical protein
MEETEKDPNDMLVVELRQALKKRGLSTSVGSFL